MAKKIKQSELFLNQFAENPKMIALRWRPIIGHPMYRVSNKGDVISLYYDRVRIMKSWKNQDGYKNIELDRKMYMVHRLVLCAFSNKPLNYELKVNHIDENKINNCLSNLEWTTDKQNKRHSSRNKIVDHNGNVYISNWEAEEKLGLRKCSVSGVLTGEKTHTMGYSFKRYKDWDGKPWKPTIIRIYSKKGKTQNGKKD